MALLFGQQVSGRCLCERQATIAGSSTSGFFQGSAIHSSRVQSLRAIATTSLTVECRYKGRGTDLSRVPEFRRHEADTGSSEVQISQLSARITQLTMHLKVHKKDYASRRGLSALLSRRRHFMQYLYRHDRSKYDHVVGELSIRPLRIQAGRGVVVKATEEGLVVTPEKTAGEDPAA